MRRLKTNEEGAVAIVVAVMLIMLFGLGALVVDVGNLYWERRQLQLGADAAALAAAQDLVEGESEADAFLTARFYANENNSRGAFVRPSIAPEPGFVVDASSVTVTARSGTLGGEAPLPSILAGVLGVDTYATQATAVASWGYAGSANTVPLTFSLCEWNDMTGGDPEKGDSTNLPTGERVVYFHSSQTAKNINTCGGPANQDHPGGFGWLSPEGGKCEAYIENGEVQTDVGNNVPSECTESWFKDNVLDKTVIMPIFSHVDGQGSKSIYTIVGFAALEVSGYKFSGSKYNEPSGDVPCSGNDRCIRGKFVEYWDISEPPEAGGQDFGAYMIGLTG